MYSRPSPQKNRRGTSPVLFERGAAVHMLGPLGSYVDFTYCLGGALLQREQRYNSFRQKSLSFCKRSPFSSQTMKSVPCTTCISHHFGTSRTAKPTYGLHDGFTTHDPWPIEGEGYNCFSVIQPVEEQTGDPGRNQAQAPAAHPARRLIHKKNKTKTI